MPDAYFHRILRYNLNPHSESLMETQLEHSIETVSETLAAILTQYLRNNWVNSPAPKRNITATTNMVTELQLDSFQVMEFMLEVEDHYDLAINLESLSNIHTISDLAGVVIAAHSE